ncbi:MAG TPA: IS5 family transposase [Planctomycetaceae bacterium]
MGAFVQGTAPRREGLRPGRGADRTASGLDRRQGPPERLDRASRAGRRRAGRTRTEADARRRPGRSRGGLTTKVHAGCLQSGRLWDLEPTEGRRRDGEAGERLLKRSGRGQVGAIVADAGYDTNGMRRQVRRIRAGRCIKPTRSRKGPRRDDRKLYRQRNKIERLFGRLKRFRRVATRYEKGAASYAGFLRLAALFVDVL